MDPLESLILKEARRQGVIPNAEAMRRAALDLAGSAVTDAGLISMPGKGVISRSDFVTSLRAHIPQAFSPISTDNPASVERRSDETLTSYMRRTIEAGPRKKLPADWDAVRSRVTGLTAKSMDHISKNRSAQ